MGFLARNERRVAVQLGLSLLVAGLMLLEAGGCSRKEPNNDPAAAGVTSHVEQITDEECLKFAKSIEQMVKSGDIAAFNQAIDWDAIIARATTPRKAPEYLHEVFRSRTKQNITQDGGIAGNIIKLAQAGGRFSCLRIRAKDGIKRAVFRLLILERPALDYFDFILSRRADGNLVISDIDNYRSGELLSQSIREDYQLRAAMLPKAMQRAKPTRQDIDFVENDELFKEMEACAHAGEARRALDIYHRLPPAMQTARWVLLARIEAANLLGGKEYDEASQALQSAFPDDPCLDILLPGYYLAHQQYDKFRAAMDRLDERTGGDPYLDFRRALCYWLERKPSLARDCAKKAIAGDGTLLVAHDLLLELALEERDFDEVSRQLTAVEEKSGEALCDFSTMPKFAEFVKSPQYQTWLKTRPK